MGEDGEDDLTANESTDRSQDVFGDVLDAGALSVRDELVGLGFDGGHGDREVHREHGHDDPAGDGVDDAGADLQQTTGHVQQLSGVGDEGQDAAGEAFQVE